jgi:hypothetical protein
MLIKKRKILSKCLQKHCSMHTYKFKREGSRRVGRPRLRWAADVEKDNRVRKGKQKAVYRDE